MRRFPWVLMLLWATATWGAPRVESSVALALGDLESQGQVSDPRMSPDAAVLGFEFLGAGGDSLEVYTASLALGSASPVLNDLSLALPAAPDDPFQLGGAAGKPVSEHLSWGPPKRGRPRFVLAATRRAAQRGAAQTNFDLYLVEPGRRRFLTTHPENDAQPAFSPDGEFVAFASGRSGQGDLYLYHFFAQAEPLARITHEAAGSEFYPVWSPDGRSLAYTGHLGSQDHLYLVDQVRTLASPMNEARAKAEARRLTRDLTPGWRSSCLAPSFSPDGSMVAFYSREGAAGRADLYVVPVAGGEPRLLLTGGLPESRGGPRWAPDGTGLFAVREDADRLNPLLWVPLAAGQPPVELDTGTELNADPYPFLRDDQLFLLLTAQGAADGGTLKRWRRIHLLHLLPEEGK